MPKAQTVTVTSSHRRPHGGSKRPASQAEATLSYAEVVEHGEVRYVLVPIKDYERLVELDMVRKANATLDDPATKWVDADQFGRELAGDEVAAARKRAGLTQKQLAAKLGIPQSQVSRIERHPDHTTVRTLKKVAKALGVRLGALVR